MLLLVCNMAPINFSSSSLVSIINADGIILLVGIVLVVAVVVHLACCCSLQSQSLLVTPLLSGTPLFTLGFFAFSFSFPFSFFVLLLSLVSQLHILMCFFGFVILLFSTCLPFYYITNCIGSQGLHFSPSCCFAFLHFNIIFSLLFFFIRPSHYCIVVVFVNTIYPGLFQSFWKACSSYFLISFSSSGLLFLIFPMTL